MRIRRWYFVAANVVTLMFIVTYHVLSNTPPPKQMTLNASVQKGPALRSAERTELQLGSSTCGPQSSSDAKLLGQSCVFECVPHRTCNVASDCAQCKCPALCFHQCILNVCYCNCCEQVVEAKPDQRGFRGAP